MANRLHDGHDDWLFPRREQRYSLSVPINAHPQTITVLCKFCNSTKVVKFGMRGGVQYYFCRPCQRKFAGNNALPGMRVPPEQIATALGLFYDGLTLNSIRRELEHKYEHPPSVSTVYEWVMRFTQVAVDETDALVIQTGDVWVAGETAIKLGRDTVWLWDVVDNDTRFLLASYMQVTRTIQGVMALMHKAQETAGHWPKVVICDKLMAYLDGPHSMSKSDDAHLQLSRFNVQPDLTLMERYHVTLRDRTKVMRGMQNMDAAELIMRGWRVHYNFFKPHQDLNHKTPREAAHADSPHKSWEDVIMGNRRRQEITIPT